MNVKHLFFTIFGISTLLLGCNSNSSNTSGSKESRNVSQEEAITIDPNAMYESNGVGKFKNIDISTLDATMARQGEVVFQSKCASCHTTGKERLIGPGLKNITNIRTPEWIMNMTYNSEEMAFKDPLAKQLKKEYKLPMMISGGITDEECRQVLEYLRKMDKE